MRAGAATRIEADLEQPILAGMGSGVAGVSRLPSDPVVERITPYGSVSWRYPGTVVVIDKTRERSRSSARCRAAAGWFARTTDGCGCSDSRRRPMTAQHQREPAVLPGEGHLGGALEHAASSSPLPQVSARSSSISGGQNPQEGPLAGGQVPGGTRAGWWCGCLPVNGGDLLEVGPADLTADVTVRTGGGEVWFGNPRSIHPHGGRTGNRSPA